MLAPCVGRGEKEGRAASNGSKNHRAPKYQNTHCDANLEAEARRAFTVIIRMCVCRGNGGRTIVRLDGAQVI